MSYYKEKIIEMIKRMDNERYIKYLYTLAKTFTEKN